MPDRDALLAFLLENNKPELLEHPEDGPCGMVYQVWEDGEITLQKGGELLWQRHLHMIMPPHPELKNDPMMLPIPLRSNPEHTYVVLPGQLYDTVKTMIWGF